MTLMLCLGLLRTDENDKSRDCGRTVPSHMILVGEHGNPRDYEQLRWRCQWWTVLSLTLSCRIGNPGIHE
jgi:hypothetical protein